MFLLVIEKQFDISRKKVAKSRHYFNMFIFVHISVDEKKGKGSFFENTPKNEGKKRYLFYIKIQMEQYTND